MSEVQDIKLKENDSYRINITLAFIFFALFIIVIITSVVMFYWTKLSTENFQNRVTLESKNIVSEFNQKLSTAKNSASGIVNGTFLNEIKPSEQFLAIIFKTFLMSNKDFIKLSYIQNNNNFFCKKYNNNIFCNYGNLYKDKNKLHLNTKIDVNSSSSIQITTDLSNFFKSIPTDIFNMIVLDEKGKVLYSNFIKAKSIYDIFTHNLADKILKEDKKFVTNDIYIDKLNHYKIVFIQNKKLLKKQKIIARNLAISMFVLSMILAVFFGYFFSKPLYKFYDRLNEKVKEEIEKNREKEQMLMHQSKLAALGEMLGNIAHQWRHPITRLSLLIQNFELAYKMGKIDDKFVDKFKTKANEQINYMSNTIDDFTSFFKKDKQKQKFYVEEVIEDALKLLEGRIKNVKIIKEYETTIMINGYKTEFSQVILNILNNAIDVLNERKIENKKIWIKIKSNLIEIEDNAGGIAEDIKEKIFEPYFTTKFQSQGTGIGLYMSKIIITKHFNSKLEVENSKFGAIFKIILNNNS